MYAYQNQFAPLPTQSIPPSGVNAIHTRTYTMLTCVWEEFNGLHSFRMAGEFPDAFLRYETIMFPLVRFECGGRLDPGPALVITFDLAVEYASRLVDHIQQSEGVELGYSLRCNIPVS